MSDLTKSVAVRLTVSGAEKVKATLDETGLEADKLSAKRATIEIDANAEDWEAKAEEALVKAKELGVLKPTIKITADTAEAEAKMLEVYALAEKIGDLNPKITVRASSSDGSLLRDAEGLGGVAASEGGSGGGIGGLFEGGLTSPAGIGAIGAAAIGAVAIAPAAIGAGVGLAGGAGGLAMAAQTKEGAAQISELEKQLKQFEQTSGQAFAPLLGQLTIFAESLLPEATKIMKDFVPVAKNMFTAMEPGIKAALPALDQFVKALAPVAGPMGKAIGGVILAMAQALKDLAPALQASTRFFVDFMQGVGLAVKGIAISINFLVQEYSWMMNGVERALSYLGDQMSDWYKVTANFFSEAVSAAVSMAGGVRGAFDIFIGALETAWDTVARWQDNVHSALDNVIGWFGRLPGQIIGELSGLAGALEGIGANMINGLISGIEGAAGHVLSVIRSIGSEISSAFKSVMGIFSPSRVFAQHGRDIVLGLVQGIDNNTHLATNSVRKLGAATSGGLAGSMGGHSAGGSPVNVTVQGIITNPTQTARQIQQLLLQLQRQNGNRSLGLA